MQLLPFYNFPDSPLLLLVLFVVFPVMFICLCATFYGLLLAVLKLRNYFYNKIVNHRLVVDGMKVLSGSLLLFFLLGGIYGSKKK